MRKYKTKNLNIFFLLSLLPSCLLFFFFYFIILLNVRVHFCYHCGGERRKKSLPQYGKILATVANSLIPSVCFKREYILRFIKKDREKNLFAFCSIARKIKVKNFSRVGHVIFIHMKLFLKCLLSEIYFFLSYTKR